jgi:NitT/TauT family transport system substrate-binding protein
MTSFGKFVFAGLIIFAASFVAWKWWDRLQPTPKAGQAVGSSGAAHPVTSSAQNPVPVSSTSSASAELPELVEPRLESPILAAPGNFIPKDNVVEIELSEYPGYAGIIVANGGLNPTENSVFFKKHGFKLKITLSEEESWSALNSGKMAASATTVDVLAVYCRTFQVQVPLQIGFSRGADGLVVRQDIKRINGLKGRVLATSQFTEADFFVRYLAQEAGIDVKMLSDLRSIPDSNKLNLVYCGDAFVAGDLFLQDLRSGKNQLAGCVTWAPKTTEIPEQSQNQAHILTSNRNLLIVADILVVNRGFANQYPEKVAGLVDGILEGNRLVRDNPESYLDVIGSAFRWDRNKTKNELAKVHLSNLPENLAFFAGSIDSAGSYGGIYQSALMAYGSSMIKNPVDGDRFLELKYLKELSQNGAYKDQRVSIAPLKSGARSSVEENPLLSKDIRFLFEPNSEKLDMNDPTSSGKLEMVHKLLQVSPGSTILLRGHVDNSLVEEFRRKGGDSFVRQMALQAVELSKKRAKEIRKHLIEKHKIDASRVETIGRGWEEPLGSDHEQNRRVEVQWFTIE